MTNLRIYYRLIIFVIALLAVAPDCRSQQGIVVGAGRVSEYSALLKGRRVA